MMRKLFTLTLILLAVGAAATWWQRDFLLSTHYFRQLARADENDRAVWLKRLIALDGGVVWPALRCFTGTDHARSSDAEAVLIGLGKQWKDARIAGILQSTLSDWQSFSGQGRNSALSVARSLLDECQGDDAAAVEAVKKPAGELLKLAVQDARTRRSALKLAAALQRIAPAETPRDFLTQLTAKGLAAEEAETRSLALLLLMHPPLSQDAKLLAKALPCLRDQAAPVRRSALLVLSGNQDLLSNDDLLPLLHDADADVRRICETSLRSRGLPDEHIFLARLISDERPAVRLEVLRHLGQIADLDCGVWLRRLGQDSSAAVRAAAVRAAGCQQRVDLSELLREIAASDASPTVRQIAGFYVRRHLPAVTRR